MERQRKRQHCIPAIKTLFAIIVVYALSTGVSFSGKDCPLIPQSKVLSILNISVKNKSFEKSATMLRGATACRWDNGKFGSNGYQVIVIAKRKVPKNDGDHFLAFRNKQAGNVTLPKYKSSLFIKRDNLTGKRKWFTGFGSLGGAHVVLALSPNSSTEIVIAVKDGPKKVNELKSKLIKIANEIALK